MSLRSPMERRTQQLHIGIMQMLHQHRIRFFTEPANELMCIYLSEADARVLDERAQTPPGCDFHPISGIQDGDTGTLMGVRFSVDATLRAGRAFIGYRVVAPDPRDLDDVT